jgi:hypothetical protein
VLLYKTIQMLWGSLFGIYSDPNQLYEVPMHYILLVFEFPSFLIELDPLLLLHINTSWKCVCYYINLLFKVGSTIGFLSFLNSFLNMFFLVYNEKEI